MKKERLSDEIGKIDEDLIAEADKVRQEQHTVPKKKPIFIAASVVTAAAVLAGVVFIPKLTAVPAVGPDVTEATSAVTVPPAVTTTGSVSDEVKLITSGRVKPKSSIISNISAIASEEDIHSGVGKLKLKESLVSSDAEFRITPADSSVDEDIIRKSIRISPDTDYTIKRDSDGSFLLKTNTLFARGSLIKFEVLDDNGDVENSWAFRTADDFRVASVFPASDSQFIPADTGIEVTFTALPDPSCVKDYFSVFPPTEGKLMTKGNSLYFVPEEQLKNKTKYTVMIKKGFRSLDGEELAEDKTFRFYTSEFGSDGSYLYTRSSSSGFSETFLPGDQTCVEIACSDDLKESEFDLHLYRFGDADGYRAALEAKNAGEWTDGYITDTSKLTEVFTSHEKPYTFPDTSGMKYDPYGTAYILLPDNLEKGCYIADISTGGGEYALQYLIQVCPLSVYSLGLGDENLFFVNDPETGKPAAGASVKLTVGGNVIGSGTTDTNGIVYIKADNRDVNALVSVEYGTVVYNDAIILSGAENVRFRDLYYMYLYTDRSTYLTSDTINVWGVVIPRSRDISVPDNMKLCLGSEEKAVVPGEDGTFTAKFSFSNHISEWTQIGLYSGGELMCGTGISIFDYDKPEYTITVDTPDYVVMPQDIPVTADITTAYFNGTPASVMISCEDIYSDSPEMLMTDADGKAHLSMLISDMASGDTWMVRSAGIRCGITGIEDSYNVTYKWIPALYRDRMCESYYDDNSRTLTIDTYDLDMNRAGEFFSKAEERYQGTVIYDYDILKAGKCDIPVNICIEHNWNEKRETGSYYDRLEKRNVKTYEYNYMNETVYDRTFSTVNGTLTLNDLPIERGEGTYTIKISFSDSRGRNVRTFIWPDNGSGLTLKIDDGYGSASARFEGNTNYRVYSLTAGHEDKSGTADNRFTENENLRFRLRSNHPEDTFDGKLLFTMYKSDLVLYRVIDMNGSDSFEQLMSEMEMIPTVRYEGAYFDGKHIFKVYGGSLSYDPENSGERRIELGVSANRDKYDAGDTAVITVSAKEHNGRPLSGARILLSIVDEAAFVVSDQHADPLGSIYSYIDYPTASSFQSYVQHYAVNRSAGEMGSGGEAGVRSDFRDTALFEEALTDVFGNAVFTVKLPDDLTEWRLTALAVKEVSEDVVFAGKKISGLITTRPLFVTPIMQTRFTEGDDISVSARCAGLSGIDTINVTLTGNGVEKTIAINQQETADFGKLASGTYTIRFKAERDGFSDILEKEITVEETLLETDVTLKCDLEELGTAIRPTGWPVTVALFNKEYMLTADVLGTLTGYSGSNLGARFASDYALFRLGFTDKELLTKKYALSTSEGYASELPYSEGNAELTAKMAVLLPEIISSKARQEYYEALTAEKAVMTDICSAFLARAALGEPVQDEIKVYIAENDIKNPKVGIYLSTALALCGDFGGAYDVYTAYVPELTVNDSDPDAVTAYVTGPSGKADNELTALALMTASVIDLPEAEQLARYLIGTDEKYMSAPELAVFSKYYVPASESEASFSCVINGSEKTVELERYYPTVIEFTEEQFRNAGFEVKSGKVLAIAYYTGRISENASPRTMKITKEISGSSVVGEEMTVDILTAPYSLVYDVIPSCGKTEEGSSGRVIVLYTDKNGKASYTFTANVSGEFVIESAAVYDQNGNWGASERSLITIKDGNAT